MRKDNRYCYAFIKLQYTTLTLSSKIYEDSYQPYTCIYSLLMCIPEKETILPYNYIL